MEKEALFYETDGLGRLDCRLCPRQCRIENDRTGACRVRRRRGDRLFSLNYGRLAALAVDPVEKKPLYHFLPGSHTLSFAGLGCNLNCRFCQNHSLSQLSGNETDFGREMQPDQIVALAVSRGIPSLSFTYSEPTVFFEMMLECARQAHCAGIKTILVSNGFINPDPLQKLIPYIDAANIDLKAWSDEFYRTLCAGRLAPVLDSLRALRQARVWLEITTLIIPGANDDPFEIDALIAFIADLGRDIPWHVSRFHPQYRLTDRPATPESRIGAILERAQQIGLQHLYAGNLPHNLWQDTHCPQCQATLIRRHGYDIRFDRLSADGRCTVCQHPLPGVFVPSGT